jgi:fucose 4-O-acetylase-like acetyltransferase
MRGQIKGASVEKRRVDWIDAARGIAIILVIMGHAPSNQQFVQFIYAFHIPLFFFLSGLVSPDSKFSFKGKARTLLIPYAAFCLIDLILFAGYEQRVTGWNISIRDAAIGFAYSSITTLKLDAHLWFLPCLFLTSVYAHLLWRSFSRRKVIAIAVFTSVVFWAVAGYRLTPAGRAAFIPRLPWSADVALMALLFYVAGQGAATLAERLSTLRARTSLAGAIAAFALTFALSRLNGQCDMVSTHFENYFLYVGAAFCGIVGACFVAVMATRIAPLRWLGKNTMVIYAFHPNAFLLLNFAFGLYYQMGLGVVPVQKSFLWGGIYSAFALAVTSPLSAILNRAAPWMVGRRRAGRPISQNPI